MKAELERLVEIGLDETGSGEPVDPAMMRMGNDLRRQILEARTELAEPESVARSEGSGGLLKEELSTPSGSASSECAKAYFHRPGVFCKTCGQTPKVAAKNSGKLGREPSAESRAAGLGRASSVAEEDVERSNPSSRRRTGLCVHRVPATAHCKVCDQ